MATERGDARGRTRNVDTGWDINVSGKVFNETRAHTGPANIYARDYIPYINDIVKKAVLLDSYGVAVGKAKSGNSLLMHSMYAVADIGKGPELIKLYVEEMRDVNSVHTTKRAYQLQNIEHQQPSAKGSSERFSPVISTADIETISDLYAAVKQRDKNFQPKPVHPAMLNADGTPRAVRQGVDATVEVLDGKTALQDGEAVYVKLENPYPAGTAAEVPDSAALEAGGYDGAVYQDENGGTHYAVLDGTQLKSATDNTGTFDGRNHNLRFSRKAGERTESAPGRIYDYSKPFAEQVDDWMAGQTPQYDTLLIGRTPLLYRQIGLSDVPMTIDQTHLDYMVNGTKNEDHHLGVALVRQLPELLEHPVAVIESATRQDDSVLAIVKGKVNGKQMVAAVHIGGNGVQNGAQIDSNHIVSAQGRGNAVTKLLNDALQKELRGEAGVYYWNKEEALSLTVRAGVQFPGGRINDGLIHSIFDAASPVNRNYLEQTETQQFKRWFGRSGVVQADGTPRAGDSVMAIARGKVNGKQLVAAVRIGGNGVQNGAQIDSNHIVSAQGRGNAVTKLLNDALQKELRGEAGVYYWNKEEALSLTVRAGVQFPGGRINDGLIHSIFDAASPVNRNYLEQTETRQFKRWFAAALSPLTSIAGLPEVNLQIRVHFRVRSVPGNAYFGLIRRQFCIKYCK